VADVRVTDLQPLAAPDGADVLLAVDVSADRDSKLTITALQTLLGGSFATAGQGALAATALQPGDVDLGYTAATRTITNTAGNSAVLPLFTSAAAGLAPAATGGGTTNFLRADGTWAAPPAGGGGGGGTVTQVDGGAGLTGSVTTTGSLAVGAGTGITVNANDVQINRATTDAWYATAAQGALAATALQPGSVDLGYTAATRTITNTGGDPAVLPLFGTAAGLVPGTASSTTNFLRADGTWAAPAGGGGGATNLDGLTDVRITSPQARDVLVYAGPGPGWENMAESSLLFSATETGFVPQSGGGTSNFLRADGTWAAPPAGGGGATNLDGLTDVTITTPATDQVLKYNGTAWVNAAAPGGGGGTVTQVTGGAGLTGNITTTGALAVGAGTGITVNADDVQINRTVTDGWYAATTHAHGGITAAGAIGSTANLPIITGASGVLQAGSFGSAANTFCQGNDSRLSDARTPAAHNQAGSTITGAYTGCAMTVSTGKLMGRSSTGTGAVEEITLGTGLSFSGGALNVLPGATAGALDDLSDVSVLTPAAGQLLGYNSGSWRNLSPNSLKLVESNNTSITGADAITNMVSLTQAEYDAIGSKSATTLYVIVG
jgi:hypothetical protein